ncbi:MAG: hypothetical protein IJX34_02435 [Clostridia bacterium]|nr:hypothetical protein [Clostridia bacterium]
MGCCNKFNNNNWQGGCKKEHQDKYCCHCVKEEKQDYCDSKWQEKDMYQENNYGCKCNLYNQGY